MKTLHVSVNVEDLNTSIRFYSKLFAHEPTMKKSAYAQWLLDDPKVNFAIVECGGSAGFGHLGIQAETEDELQEIYTRYESIDADVLDEGNTTCCYANSTKSWITDPANIGWEAFHTNSRTREFFSDGEPDRPALKCC